ncbi:aldo-keto reductase family 1 member C1-like [Pseudophryne corroboree]|uniref:aldo-keto reductase family 1 member C1-like n=1 Tax=Pseudophryne corroboree TaxID=495146 RepID=UPI00308170B6
MALKEDSYVVLNDGHKMPVIGFGTYAPQTVAKSLAEEGVKVALEVGYRHIDCAFIYGNEVEVGRAIREKIADGTVKREDVFYTGKLWSNSQTPDRVRPALEKSLKDLQLDYMDLFIIHSPIEFKPGDEPFPLDANGKLIYHNTDIRDTWKALEECKDAGLVKSIGVSNFNKSQLELILNNPKLKYKPVCNQVTFYGNREKFQDKPIMKELLNCILVKQDTPVLLEDPVLNEIAKKNKRSPAQVAMRYLLQRGLVIIAKSFSPDRIKQNFQVFDFELSGEDMKCLDGLNRGVRYLNLDEWKEHPKYSFHDEY